MTIANENGAPIRLEGKFSGMLVCWILGLGSLVSWNSILTINDYYYHLFPGPEQNALGNLLVLFLLGGLFAGVALDWLWLIGKEDF